MKLSPRKFAALQKIKDQEESPLTLEEKMQESMDIPQGNTKTVVKVISKLNSLIMSNLLLFWINFSSG